MKDKPYCRSDWKKLFAPRCDTCKRPISQALTGDHVMALDKEYHPECFICKVSHNNFDRSTAPPKSSILFLIKKDCQLILDPRSYYEVDNQPFCYEHYHNKTCTDCLKAKHEKISHSRKVVPRANSTITRRSMTPIDFFLRPKSSAF